MCYRPEFPSDQIKTRITIPVRPEFLSTELVPVAPGEEPDHGPVVCHPGIFVADGGGEEFEEAP